MNIKSTDLSFQVTFVTQLTKITAVHETVLIISILTLENLNRCPLTVENATCYSGKSTPIFWFHFKSVLLCGPKMRLGIRDSYIRHIFIIHFHILLLTAALTFVNGNRNRRNKPNKFRKRKQNGPSARRILYATQIKTDKSRLKTKNAESTSQNDATTETFGNYICDFSADNRTTSLSKIDQIMTSNINNKQERLRECRIISNSCFPGTIRELQDASINSTASYEEQRSNLYNTREQMTLDREETRLLVVSALRCEWTLNNRMCACLKILLKLQKRNQFLFRPSLIWLNLEALATS